MKLTLYHGSKGGLVGPIGLSDRNRTKCDFGRGFYMGDTRTQPLTLICDDENPVLYTLKFEKVYTPQKAGRIMVRQERQRTLGVSRAEAICRRERREGLGFDEVLARLLEEDGK